MLHRQRRRVLGTAARPILVALGVGVLLLAGGSVAACGGDDPPASPSPESSATTASADESAAPEPVSSLPPLCSLGEAARFQTREEAVVRVVVDSLADPGEATGAEAGAGERLVTLELSVTAEGEEGTAAVPLPFAKADSFLLVAADDTLYVAQLGDPDLLGAVLAPGESLETSLAFAVPEATQVLRLVCTPVEGTVPRSATWELE